MKCDWCGRQINGQCVTWERIEGAVVKVYRFCQKLCGCEWANKVWREG